MTKGGEGRQEELLDGRRGAVRAVDVLVLKKGCRGTLGRASWLERRLQGESVGQWFSKRQVQQLLKFRE